MSANYTLFIKGTLISPVMASIFTYNSKYCFSNEPLFGDSLTGPAALTEVNV